MVEKLIDRTTTVFGLAGGRGQCHPRFLSVGVFRRRGFDASIRGTEH